MKKFAPVVNEHLFSETTRTTYVVSSNSEDGKCNISSVVNPDILYRLDERTLEISRFVMDDAESDNPVLKEVLHDHITHKLERVVQLESKGTYLAPQYSEGLVSPLTFISVVYDADASGGAYADYPFVGNNGTRYTREGKYLITAAGASSSDLVFRAIKVHPQLHRGAVKLGDLVEVIDNDINPDLNGIRLYVVEISDDDCLLSFDKKPIQDHMFKTEIAKSESPTLVLKNSIDHLLDLARCCSVKIECLILVD